MHMAHLKRVELAVRCCNATFVILTKATRTYEWYHIDLMIRLLMYSHDRLDEEMNFFLLDGNVANISKKNYPMSHSFYYYNVIV